MKSNFRILIHRVIKTSQRLKEAKKTGILKMGEGRKLKPLIVNKEDLIIAENTKDYWLNLSNLAEK